RGIEALRGVYDQRSGSAGDVVIGVQPRAGETVDRDARETAQRIGCRKKARCVQLPMSGEAAVVGGEGDAVRGIDRRGSVEPGGGKRAAAGDDAGNGDGAFIGGGVCPDRNAVGYAERAL